MQDELYIVERENYFMAQRFLDSERAAQEAQAATNSLAEIYTTHGLESFAASLEAAATAGEFGLASYHTYTWLALKNAASATKVAESGISLGSSLVATGADIWITAKSDDRHNDFYYVNALNDHHDMLELLSREIADAYGILEEAHSRDIRQVERALRRVPTLIFLYHAVYAEIAANSRYDKLSYADLRQELKLLFNELGMPPYHQERTSAAAVVERERTTFGLHSAAIATAIISVVDGTAARADEPAIVRPLRFVLERSVIPRAHVGTQPRYALNVQECRSDDDYPVKCRGDRTQFGSG